ncbi:MAG: MAE_28990/MAE_18760 family HEPN-like nuclease [Crocosphaera sp.]
MKIRTIEQLSDQLSEDLIWRKKELSEVEKLVKLNNVSPEKRDLFIRSGIDILYSHWEGFIKLAANAYLEYVRLQKLSYQQLSNNFLALAMKEKLKDVKETNQPSLYIPVCDFFLLELNNRSSLPKEAISTASNLSSKVLKEITTILGIDFSFYSTKSKLIDEKLLKSRNEIAHGNYLLINRDGYIELHEIVIEMINTFRTQIENAAINEDFKRNSS